MFLVVRKNDPAQTRMAMKVVKKRVVKVKDLEHIRTERQGTSGVFIFKQNFILCSVGHDRLSLPNQIVSCIPDSYTAVFRHGVRSR